MDIRAVTHDAGLRFCRRCMAISPNVVVILLAGLSNLWAANLFFGLLFVFGASWAFLALLQWGRTTYFLAGAVAIGVAQLQIYNPMFAIMSSMELAFIALLFQRRQQDLIFSSVAYWCLPAPLLFFAGYKAGLSGDLDTLDALVVYLKMAINGILNALFASLLHLVFRFLQPRTPSESEFVPIHQAFFNVLLALILIPSLFMTSIHSQARFERMETLLTQEVKARAEIMSEYLAEWHAHQVSKLTELGRMTVRLRFSNSTDHQTMAELVQAASQGLEFVYLADRFFNALALAFPSRLEDPSANLGQQQIQANRWLTQNNLESFAWGRDLALLGPESALLLTISVPIEVEGHVQGYTLGGVSTRWLESKLAHFLLRENWHATVVDREARMLFSSTSASDQGPYAAVPGTQVSSTGTSTYVRQRTSPQTSPFIRWQENSIGAITEVPHLGWRIYAEASIKPYAASLKRDLAENLVLMLVLSLLGLGVSAFLARVVGRPIQILADLTSDIRRYVSPDQGLVWPRSRIQETARLIRNYKLMQQELSERLTELETANRAKSAFLATISHEIRTPLSAILGFSEFLLKDQSINHQQSEHLRAIQRNSEQLLAIIGDVLDLSKIEAGKLILEQFPVQVIDLVQDVLHSLQLQCRSKGLQFELIERTPLTIRVLTDPTRFRQILWNLASNAIKFTSTGMIRVIVSQERRAGASHATLSIAFEDTGIGIDPMHHESIFDAFTQADSSMTRRFGGSGLGLVLARRIAVALGGRLDLDWSAVGQGSRFIFSLPLLDADKQEEESRSPCLSASSPPASRLKGTRVLVVDDAPDNLLLTRFMLEEYGASVTCVQNAFEALRMLQMQTFDLILTDLQMPELDGYGFIKQVRLQDLKLPIIAMTAHAIREEHDRSLAAGCDLSFSKPLDATKVVQAIETLTKSKLRKPVPPPLSNVLPP